MAKKDEQHRDYANDGGRANQNDCTNQHQDHEDGSCGEDRRHRTGFQQALTVIDINIHHLRETRLQTDMFNPVYFSACAVKTV